MSIRHKHESLGLTCQFNTSSINICLFSTQGDPGSQTRDSSTPPPIHRYEKIGRRRRRMNEPHFITCLKFYTWNNIERKQERNRWDKQLTWPPKCVVTQVRRGSTSKKRLQKSTRSAYCHVDAGNMLSSVLDPIGNIISVQACFCNFWIIIFPQRKYKHKDLCGLLSVSYIYGKGKNSFFFLGRTLINQTRQKQVVSPRIKQRKAQPGDTPSNLPFHLLKQKDEYGKKKNSSHKSHKWQEGPYQHLVYYLWRVQKSDCYNINRCLFQGVE